jgi:hypothetical protein
VDRRTAAAAKASGGQFSQWRLLEVAAESAVAMLRKIAADTVTGEADKFEEDSLKSDQEKAAQAAARQAAEARRAAATLADQKKSQKRAVEHAVELAIAAATAENEDDDEDEDEDERGYGELYSDLYERLNDFEDYSDLGRKSTGEIVEQICRLLNLPFDPAL